jgi:two-component system phosphate regulon response regulator PhoB
VSATRIVWIDEGPLKEKLANLLDRPNGALGGSGSVECVGEAHILAPNLILLDLTHACAEGARASQQAHDDAPIHKLAQALLPDQCGDERAATAFKHDSQTSQPSEQLSVSSEEVSEEANAADHEPILRAGPVRIDRHGHWAYLNEKKLHLTPTEFRLLECFLREPGRAFTRSQLLDVSMGNASFVLERTIDVHIRTLRTKLEAARDLVETVRGVGYRFRDCRDPQ